MKNVFNVLVYSLVICFGLTGIAEAKGRAASFRGGFSSQQRSAPKPVKKYYTPQQAPMTQEAPMTQAAPVPQNRNTSFGSFGDGTNTNRKPASGNFQPSQMSKDLHANAANANALKTADARSNPAGAGGVNGNTNSGWFGGDKNLAGNTQARIPANSPPAIPRTATRDHGGFMSGLMWFMLGNSLAQHNTQYVPINNAGASASMNAGASDMNGVSDGLQPMQSEPKEHESFFMKFLRFVLLLAFIGSIVWGA